MVDEPMVIKTRLVISMLCQERVVVQCVGAEKEGYSQSENVL